MYFFVPMNLSDVVGQKAQVQAVKDVLSKKGVPDEMDTGPLGNILGMAGIKTPPKGARRKTQRRKRTRRNFARSPK